MENNTVIEYYDNYVAHQQAIGVNERLFSLYQRMKKLGLKHSSKVLELGCGIGEMTALIARKATKGQIEAVNISGKSIAYANQQNKNPNILFAAADTVYYKPKKVLAPDFITLFDVIEHIPADKHPDLFQNIAQIATENTLILINIPNPACTEYDQIHHPELLQVIDLVLPIDFIAQNLVQNGLEMVSAQLYSIWIENDYQFFLIRKKQAFKEFPISQKRNLFQKIIHRLKLLYIKYCLK